MKRKEKQVGRVLALKKKQRMHAQGALEIARREMMNAAEVDKQKNKSVQHLQAKMMAPAVRSGAELESAADLFQRAHHEQLQAKRLLEESQQLMHQRREAVHCLEREIRTLEEVASRLKRARDREQSRRSQAFLDEVGAWMMRGPE